MYDVIKKYTKTPENIVKGFSELDESASINEAMKDKDGALMSYIKPNHKGTKMCGTAFTVQCGTGADNIMLHKAVSMAKPGDVLMVINGMHDEAGGLFGGMMAASLKSRGAEGIVIEGANRDSAMIGELDFPVFSKNISVKPATKAVPGKINHPIIIGGVKVYPGDLVFGDDDGVVVVPREETEEVLKIAAEREKKEETFFEDIMAGKTTTFDMFKDQYAKLNISEEED